MALCNDIDRLESEADHVMRGAIARLFRDEPDVRELIKLRTVYEHLETVTDRCEDVANIIQGIVIENSWWSVQLRAGFLDHVGPFHGLFLDECTERLGCSANRLRLNGGVAFLESGR